MVASFCNKRVANERAKQAKIRTESPGRSAPARQTSRSRQRHLDRSGRAKFQSFLEKEAQWHEYPIVQRIATVRCFAKESMPNFSSRGFLAPFRTERFLQRQSVFLNPRQQVAGSYRRACPTQSSKPVHDFSCRGTEKTSAAPSRNTRLSSRTPVVVFGVLNDIKGADQVEFAVTIWQR